MATSILLKTLNELKDINLPFKFLTKLKKKRIIKHAEGYIRNYYLVDNYFSASHIIHLCKLFNAAKVMGLFDGCKFIDNNRITARGISIDVYDTMHESAVIAIDSKTQQFVISAIDNVRVDFVDFRDTNHSYRFTYYYDILNKRSTWSNRSELIEEYSYESLLIAFNLILQIIFNAMYEKEF